MSMLKQLQDTQRKEAVKNDSKIWESKQVGTGMFAHLEGRFAKPTTKATNNRASLIEPFVKKLEVKGGKYPMSKQRICTLMAYIDTDDLDWFYKDCCKKSVFGRYWNWIVIASDLNKK